MYLNSFNGHIKTYYPLLTHYIDMKLILDLCFVHAFLWFTLQEWHLKIILQSLNLRDGNLF